MKDFKYTAKFESLVQASTDITTFNISNASLAPLEKLIPKEINWSENIDLVGVAFNAAVVNKFNKNGDGIDTKAAIAIRDNFIHKPCNIEHQKDHVVGHVVSAGFSEYRQENAAIDVQGDDVGPFNICLGAVIYRIVAPEFADMILQASDPESEFYETVSASWEIGFNDYAIAVGSGNIDEVEVITDPDDVEELSQHLRSCGGTGELEDGTAVNRLILGEIYPLGIGFTNSPAADVKGVWVGDEDEGRKNKVDTQGVREDDYVEEKSSHLNSDNVIQEEQTSFLNTMEKQELLKDIEQLLSEKAAAKDFSDEAIANITKVFHDAIREKSEEYVEQIDQAKADKAEAETQREELAKTLSELQEKLSETEKQLDGLEAEKSEREAQARFDARMSSLEEVYELDEADRKIVASEVAALDASEESFAEYQEKVSVVFKAKSKEYLQKLADEMEAKIEAEVAKRLGAASSETDTKETAEEATEAIVEESLDQAEAEEVTLPNNNGESIETEESLRDRFAKAFRDNVKVVY